MITMDEAIAEVRALVADPADVDQRWSDDHVALMVNNAVRLLLSMRPDASIGPFKEMPADTPLGGTLPIVDTYRFPVNLHSAGSLLLERASDKSLRDQGNAFITQAIKLMGV